ncbi:sodium-coupled monocarboxylate transporter 1-like protein, partial [Dinothrombium tinctorium]
MDHVEHRFGIADYCVFGFMLLVSAIIGVYYAFVDRKKNTTSEFLMGGRSIGVFPVSLSLVASFLSAITLLGTPVEIYSYGTSYWTHILIYPLIILVTATCFIPVFYKLELTSCFEYLEKRFNKSVRTLGSVCFCIQMIIYMSIVLYAPSLALSQVLSIGVVCTFYTSIGGMKAVIWTDVFQTIMMFGSMLFVVIKGALDMGGFSNVWEINKKFDRIDFFNFDSSPLTRHSFWALMIGTFFNWGSIYCTNQTMVQPGLVLFARYWNCDPISTHRVSAADQLFPLFVVETLGSIPGLSGLFVAGIFSGALSTVSSGVNSLAAVTFEDFIKGYTNINLSESNATLMTKLLAVFFGLVAIALVAVAQQMGNVLNAALSLFGLLGSPVFALFITGMFIPFVNSPGAFFGTLSGIGVSFWIGIGAMTTKPYHPKKEFLVTNCTSSNYSMNLALQESLDLHAIHLINESESVLPIYRISYMYYGVIAAFVTIVISILISLLIGKKSNPDSSLIMPIIQKYIKNKNEEFKVQNSLADSISASATASTIQLVPYAENVSTPLQHQDFVNIALEESSKQ